MPARAFALIALSLLPCPARAQTLAVEDAGWPALRAHAAALLENLDALKAPLPADDRKALDELLAVKKPKDPEAACLAVQKLLDARCLLAVHINPESRVKAKRGPLAAALLRDEVSYVLVKVHNEAGVSHRLSADSPQKVTKGEDADRWLELAVLNEKPFSGKLSGERVEYRVLKLTARQSGKREATLAFDAGQGTQDLGFRAEVPVLFAVAAKR